MSKETIAERSNLIRNEQNPEGNTKARIADQFDDINESKLEAPAGSGFYYLTTGGIAPSWSPINPTSYYAIFWTGSGFQSSDIYTSPLNGRVGIGTGAANLQYKFEVAGSTKLSTLNLANPANAQGDVTFTKSIVAKTDGTIGWENKVSQREAVLYNAGGAFVIDEFKADYYVNNSVTHSSQSDTSNPITIEGYPAGHNNYHKPYYFYTNTNVWVTIKSACDVCYFGYTPKTGAPTSYQSGTKINFPAGTLAIIINGTVIIIR